MADYAISPAELDESIQQLKDILPIDEAKRSPAQSAELYLASIRILTALKVDSDCMKANNNANNDETSSVHLWEATPAMSAVVQDSSFFHLLIQRLESPSITAAGGENHDLITSKKRSLSISEVDKKAGASPIPVPRGNHMSTQHKAQFIEPVFVATVLFSAFQYLDHWPAPLVKAYAADCFGSRIWVDHPLCEPLIQNLKLVHSAESMEVDHGSAALRDSGLVAAAYTSGPFRHEESFGNGIGKQRISVGEPRKLKRQLSSTSWGSLSDVSVQSKRVKASSKIVNDESHGNDDLQTTSSDLQTTSGDLSLAMNTSSEQDLHKRSLDDMSGDQQEVETKCDEQDDTGIERSTSFTDDESLVNTVTSSEGRLIGGSYPLLQVPLHDLTLRNRYIGENSLAAQSAIVDSLEARLEMRTRQNLGLLQCLPQFAVIPGVRLTVSTKLERWLQSPALSGLARTLLASVVENLRVVDPPLQEDLAAIDNIFSMQPKANQVSHSMFSRLLRKMLMDVDASNLARCDEMKLLVAVHKQVPPSVSYHAVANLLITFLVEAKADKSKSRKDRQAILSKMRRIVTQMANQLAFRFEGKLLLDALLSIDVRTSAWSRNEEEDKARLMFLSITLSIAPYIKDSVLSSENARKAKQLIWESRRAILTWCVREYGLYFNKKKTADKTDENPLDSLQSPKFSSAFHSKSDEPDPPWLKTMLCLLFIEEAESPSMKSFLFPGTMSAEDETDWTRELSRIQYCCSFSGTVNDDLVQIVLDATPPPEDVETSATKEGIEPEMALQILEHLLLSCRGNQTNAISIENPDLVWELYRLALFGRAAAKKMKGTKGNPVPRLANPNLWWRITMIALVICSSSPQSVGTAMFHGNPTLRGLIKMVTSGRFRFPTVDCDEESKKKMKKEEQQAREEEAKIAENLYLPPKDEPKTKAREQRGSRVSRRLLKQNQAKEAARVFEETTRRKKILKKAQKCIMLWDPDGPARKPPQDSVDLLLSVVEKFDLAVSFRTLAEPDFVLMSIGETSRSSIERAHDWLIPIVSDFPGTITRLPPNASCVLLLRAYGGGESERSELKRLSQPLLEHVKESLGGSFGENGAVKALDLLMTDIASSKSERRRCARKVLRDTLVNAEDFTGKSSTWMQRILDFPHATLLVRCSVPYMTKAASYEKGSELSNLVTTLREYIRFANNEGVELQQTFPEILVELISSRPSVLSEALSNFTELFALSAVVLHSQFSRVVEQVSTLPRKEEGSQISINLHGNDVTMQLALLISVSVLLSIWNDSNIESPNSKEAEAVRLMSNALLLEGDDEYGSSGPRGLASAKVLNGSDLDLVEPWILLAKSKSDGLARRTALSVPPNILCRILLCSGLPKTSFLTMLSRLGRFGEDPEADTLYSEMLDSASRLGQYRSRQSTARMLAGRLDAYSRLHHIRTEDAKLKKSSQIFLSWLSKICEEGTKGKPTKGSGYKKGRVVKKTKLSLQLASNIMLGLGSPRREKLEETSADQFEPPNFRTSSVDSETSDTGPVKSEESELEVLTEAIVEENWIGLEQCLKRTYLRDSFNTNTSPKKCLDASVALLKCYRDTTSAAAQFSSLVACYVPELTRETGKPELWQLIFNMEEKAKQPFFRQVVGNCIAFWTRTHKMECYSWAIKLDLDRTSGSINWDNLTVFMISVSEQPPAYASISDSNPEPSDWVDGQDGATSAVRISMQSLRSRASVRPNEHSAGFLLLFSLARLSKNHFKLVCGQVLGLVARDPSCRDSLCLFLLKLYLAYPNMMDISTASTRTALIHAVTKFSKHWRSWAPSLEGKLQDQIVALHMGESHVVKGLTELSRNLPLLILRELPQVALMLKRDAIMNDYNLERKGIIVGKNLNGPRVVRIQKKKVKLSVCHWGYNFLEPLWISWLDILSAIPKEVLFTCGLEVGLKELLEVYLELASVQLHLLSADKAERLKSKLNELFLVFKKVNNRGWIDWLGSTLEGGMEVRHVLMSYSFITPQEARESSSAANN